MKLPAEISQGKLWSALVGREVGREDWIDGHSRARQLREQSSDIAERLAAVGLDVSDRSREVVMVGLCTGMAERRSVTYRNSNLIPEVQSRNVHSVLRELQCFIENQPANKLRMLTISAGWVPLLSYNSAHRRLSRKISKFFAKPEVKALGIEPLFYNIENTIQRFELGAALNLHSHALIRCDRYLGKVAWTGFLELARRYFGKGYVHDSPLRKSAELVKYVFKPSEFEQLEDWELALLAVQCHRMKFFHPVGRFREWRRKLKEEGLRVKRVPVGDQWEWRTVPKAARPEAKNGSPPPEAGRIIAVLAPAPRFSNRLEPVFVVQGYGGDLDELARQNRLDDTLAFARELWRAAEARDHKSIRDTTTTTVPEKKQPPPDWQRRRWRESPCHANS